MPNILLVEDDSALSELIASYLQRNDFHVRVIARGDHVLDEFRRQKPDLVILDLMLPGEDGLSICRRVRGQYAGPILMLTARSDELDQIQGLDLGADDYVCKPVRPRVLLARINALLRRSEAPERRQELTFGPLHIDSRQREARLSGQLIELTGAEFDLLWLLASNAGRVLSREEIFTSLRGVGYDGQDRSIDVRISKIRPKIGDDPITPRLIKTLRSKGYLFVGEAP